jgi:hypothetical protein
LGALGGVIAIIQIDAVSLEPKKQGAPHVFGRREAEPARGVLNGRDNVDWHQKRNLIPTTLRLLLCHLFLPFYPMWGDSGFSLLTIDFIE